MKTFILACLLAVTAVSGTVVMSDPVFAGRRGGGANFGGN
jgi:hypothetical protein